MGVDKQNMFIQGAILCNSASNISVYGRLDHLETKKARAIFSEHLKIKKIKNSFFVFFWDGFWLASQKRLCIYFCQSSPR